MSNTLTIYIAPHAPLAAPLFRCAPLCVLDTRGSNAEIQKPFLGFQTARISRPTDVVLVVFLHNQEKVSPSSPDHSFIRLTHATLGTYGG